MKKIFIIVLLFLVYQSCSEESDDSANPTDNTSAKVNGEIFTPTETKATNTGTGMEVKLKDNTQEINLRLDDIVAGPYTVKNSSGGRLKTDFTVTALLVDNTGTVFYGTNGTVTLTIAPDGKAAGTFSFNAKSTTGSITSVTDGKFDRLTVGDLSSLGCLLTKIDWEGYINEFSYDSDGNISSMVYIGEDSYRDETIFSYAAGKMVRALAIYSDATSDYFISHDASGKVNIVDEQYANTNSGTSSGVTTYAYDGSGRLSKINEDFEDKCFIYTGNNLAKFGGCTAGEDFIFSLFDSKSNPGKLLLKAFGNQPALVHLFTDGAGQFASENNPGKLEQIRSSGTGSVHTYTYNEYNTKGYPVKITETDSYGDGIIALTYSNCN